MPEEKSRSFRFSPKWVIGVAAMFLVSTTFATNINLNGGGSFEFGQGIYQIKACDQFISIEFAATTTIDGYSRVGNIIIKGLDITKCKGTALRLRLYPNASQTPLELYGEQVDSVTSVSLNPLGNSVILAIQKTLTDADKCISVAGGDPTYDPDLVNIINNIGVNKCYTDPKRQALSYTPSTGIFKVKFYAPKAIMTDVAKVVIESASI